MYTEAAYNKTSNDCFRMYTNLIIQACHIHYNKKKTDLSRQPISTKPWLCAYNNCFHITQVQHDILPLYIDRHWVEKIYSQLETTFDRIVPITEVKMKFDVSQVLMIIIITIMIIVSFDPVYSSPAVFVSREKCQKGWTWFKELICIENQPPIQKSSSSHPNFIILLLIFVGINL